MKAHALCGEMVWWWKPRLLVSLTPQFKSLHPVPKSVTLAESPPMLGTAKWKEAKGAVGMGRVLAQCLCEAGAKASFFRGCCWPWKVMVVVVGTQTVRATNVEQERERTPTPHRGGSTRG